jgi:hypothetical protein
MAAVGVVEDAVKEIPDDNLPKGKADKQRLLNLARELDELPRVDENTGEVFIDEQRSRKVFEKLTRKSNEQFVNELVAGLRDRPGGELLREGYGESSAVSWKEFRNRVGAEETPWEETLEGWGLSTQSTDWEFREAVKQRMPEVPEELLEPGGMEKAVTKSMDHLAVASGETSAERASPWDNFLRCLSRTWPLWLIYAFLGVVVGFLTTLPGAIIIGAAIGFGIGFTLSVIACLATETF